MGLIFRKLSEFLLMFPSRISSFMLSYLFFCYQPPVLSLCTTFEAILSKIDEILSINPSANILAFREFNIHYNDWFTCSGGTDRPGELCYNFTIPDDLAQIVNFPKQTPDYSSHSHAVLDLFSSSDGSICPTMACPPLEIFNHVVVSDFFDFSLNSKEDGPFHRTTYDYSRADRGGLQDHLRDVPWEGIFRLGVSAAGSEYCKLDPGWNLFIYPSL